MLDTSLDALQLMLRRVMSNYPQHRVIRIWQVLLWGLKHWVLLFLVLFGFVNILPFIAPVFMNIGWTEPANFIYTIYSPLCHQMAQRSFFLFGEQPMYNIAELPVTFTKNILIDMTTLRTFIGSTELGWKVAWSDRMVYMYGAVLLEGIIFGALRHRRQIRPIGLLMFVLLLAPITIDGITHMFSDINGGLLADFRYYNQWLVDLTGNILPSWFYVGDAFGSFNSWMRFISGFAFGYGCVWLMFPHLNQSISGTAIRLQMKLQHVKNPSTVIQYIERGSLS